ncbi:unnamed protein product [Caenorhabditis auriculariae]|uniref:Uncharacterized protein n=1 Tax=Caenorhabditis auriculariae TaxID=2777116 RepID=A0A8S1HQK6_9PELO|nr:unnamed protein product [Caenorhabditis auriculariae]
MSASTHGHLNGTLIVLLGNKSVIRSTGGSYPYPRTHTTMMVVPSTRPIAPEDRPPKHNILIRRRPPLNRAIPPIPESKSNESIMSHASRVSEKQNHRKLSEEPTTGDLVIENRNVVDMLNRLDNAANIPRTKKTMSSATSTSTPRSPLMSVAHSVKNKLTRITHLGKSTTEGSRIPSTSSTSNIKTSQSFSGIRPPKSVPKRIDQNANRVIKSSSMDVPKQDQIPSTSKVSLPQNPKPLDDKIEEVSEAGLIQATELAKPREEHVCVKLEEDVLVVMKEFEEKYPGQKRSVSPDPPLFIVSETTTKVPTVPDIIETRKEEVKIMDQNANPKTPGVTRKVFTTTTTTTETSRSCRPSMGEFLLERTREIEGGELKQHCDKDVAPASQLERQVNAEPKKVQLNEEAKPKEKFVLCVRTPEALRRHHTFAIQDRPKTETKITKSHSDVHVSKRKLVKQKSVPETFTSPERYILTIKTPEALRKHNVVTIGEKVVVEEPVVEKKKVTIEEKALEPVPKKMDRERFVLVLKTPEALRRHHTFTVGDRLPSPDYPYIEEGELTEPIATIGPPAERRRKEEKKEMKRREWEESQKPVEKYVMTTTTPLAMRKFQTFVVEPKENKISTSVSADAVVSDRRVKRSESTDSKKHAFLRRLQFDLFRGRSRTRDGDKTRRQQSLDERKPPSAQKYVLSTPTPVMMRKYQTFAVTEPKKTEDVVAEITSAYKTEEKETTSPVKVQDFYSITATTPVTKRKTPTELKTPSPEPRNLFVMGGRKSPREEKKSEKNKQLLDPESPNLSRSDVAERLERKSSFVSGDLTSPEEEIPMDTNMTPTTEEVDEPIISRHITHDVVLASPIVEENENVSVSIQSSVQRVEVEAKPPPVFTPPSPPKERYSPLTSPETSSRTLKAPTQLNVKKMEAPTPTMMKKKADEKKTPAPTQKKEKERTPIASKSLRSAGKMFTNSFLRKEKKATVTPKSNVPTRSQMQLNVRNRRAPLAEFESTVVANSPAVENHPITFEKWNKSPRNPRQRFSETIAEESTDANANCFHRESAHPHDPGLIDDEILDQPMLVGDTFSHSSSMDCISTTQRIDASIVSIDRSASGVGVVTNGPSEPRSRQDDNHNGRSSHSLTAAEARNQKIDASIDEVEGIRVKLQMLQAIVNDSGLSEWETEMETLRRENARLKRELAERDAVIAALRSPKHD